MPTLTIELSDEEYRNALALPIEERRRRVSAVFATAPNLPQDEEPHLTEEDLVAIGKGLSDIDAGRVVDGFTAMAELREQRRSRTGPFARQGAQEKQGARSAS